MEHTTGQPSYPRFSSALLTPWHAGSSLSSAAEAYGVHRVTVYRWIKNHKEFAAALRQARAEFVLARRDQLYHLSNRALDALLSVLDNPKPSSPVQLRAAMFVLQRPQLPKTGWSMAEPAPNPDGNKLVDSAIIEQDYDSLPGLYHIERDSDPPAESADSEPPPPPEPPLPPPADASPCNTMQHDSPIFEDVTPPDPAG